MTDVLATGADAAYGYHALNLVGSVMRNSDIFDRIEVFDLGLSADQRAMLAAVPAVVVRPVPPFAPHWAQCFTWKPWAWMQIEADRVFWLDAGASVLRSLAEALDLIAERSYFVVSQGGRLDEIVPPDYFDEYELPGTYGEREYVAAGIIGFRPGGTFFERVLVPTYRDCLAGRNLGFSEQELPSKNRGIGYMQSPPLRDCPHFRWDQTLLNVHLALAYPDAAVADLDEYGGWRSPHDHPRQVIWSHRGGGGMRYLKHVRYRGPGALRRRAWGAREQGRRWLRAQRFADPTTYRLKLRRVLAGLRRSPH